MKTYLRQVFWIALLVHLPLIVCLLAGRWQAALIVFGITFCAMTYGIMSGTTRLFGPLTTHVNSQGVLLTIDDGPDPGTTLAMLDILDRHEAMAVFFVIGDRVQQWPHLAQEMLRRGHAIGNHSQTHPAARFWSLGPRQMWREIVAAQDSIRAATGETPTWFRAPVGHFNLFTHPALKALGLRMLSWSCRGYDGVDTNAQRVIQRLRKGLRPGAIVLLHEAMPTSLTVLEAVLVALREKGLKAVPLSDEIISPR